MKEYNVVFVVIGRAQGKTMRLDAIKKELEKGHKIVCISGKDIHEIQRRNDNKTKD